MPDSERLLVYSPSMYYSLLYSYKKINFFVYLGKNMDTFLLCKP